MCKTICLVTREDVEDICGSDQLCACTQCALEGAIHAANNLFNENEWGLLLVDARNAFNSLNRSSLLWNVRVLWPRASRFIYNTYKGHSPLIIKGSSEIISSGEGIIQGDPLSMFIYAVGSLPLIKALKLSNHSCTQIWYADDASALSELSAIRDWFDCLLASGPKFGYFPEPKKCCLVVKESILLQARELFNDLEIKITTSSRFLGGVVGDSSGQSSYVANKVRGWVNIVNERSNIASTQPQAAFSAFTKSFQHEWTYLQWVTENCGSLFKDLESVISSSFIPALFGRRCTSNDRLLFSLPIRSGGLGIRVPTETAALAYTTSRSATDVLVNAIKNNLAFSSYNHSCQVLQSRKDHSHTLRESDNSTFSDILSQLDVNHQRAILRTKDSLSAWLNVLLTTKDNFDLTCSEFRDAICLRYSKPLLGLPSNCDGCNSVFTTSHALDCKKGGLVVWSCPFHVEREEGSGDTAIPNAFCWNAIISIYVTRISRALRNSIISAESSIE